MVSSLWTLPREPLVGTLFEWDTLEEDWPLVAPICNTNFVCNDTLSMCYIQWMSNEILVLCIWPKLVEDQCWIVKREHHITSSTTFWLCNLSTNSGCSLLVLWITIPCFVLPLMQPLMLIKEGLYSMHKKCRVFGSTFKLFLKPHKLWKHKDVMVVFMPFLLMTMV